MAPRGSGRQGKASSSSRGKRGQGAKRSDPKSPRRSPRGSTESGRRGGDRVFLEGLVLPAKIGVTPPERATPRELEADIALEANLEKAGLSDRLGDTLDYAEIRRTALKVAASRTWSLLEALAEQIAGELLENYPEAFSVTVTIRKPRPPFMSGVESAGVTLARAPRR